MLDASILYEGFWYCAAFWCFILQPDYRRECAQAWRAGGVLRRTALGAHAVIATTCGLGLLVLLGSCAM
jgi:hypothetical protein